nr:vegetative cell wall protein gp1 [Aegilops tauschii subsp. strangulata]
MPMPPRPSLDPHAAAPLCGDPRRRAPLRRPAPPRPIPGNPRRRAPSPETPGGTPPNRIHPLPCALPGTPTCAAGSCGRLTPPPPAAAALPVSHSGQPRTSPSDESPPALGLPLLLLYLRGTPLDPPAHRRPVPLVHPCVTLGPPSRRCSCSSSSRVLPMSSSPTPCTARTLFSRMIPMPDEEGTKFTYCHRGNSAIPSPTTSATTVLQPSSACLCRLQVIFDV